MSKRRAHKLPIHRKRLLLTLAIAFAVLCTLFFCRRLGWYGCISAGNILSYYGFIKKAEAGDLHGTHDIEKLAAVWFRISESFTILPYDEVQLSSSLWHRSDSMERLGRFNEAESLLRRRMALSHRYHGIDSDEYDSNLTRLAFHMFYYQGYEITRIIPEMTAALHASDAVAESRNRTTLLKYLVIAYYLAGDVDRSDAMFQRYTMEIRYGDIIDQYYSIMSIYGRTGDAARLEQVKKHVLQNEQLMETLKQYQIDRINKYKVLPERPARR